MKYSLIFLLVFSFLSIQAQVTFMPIDSICEYTDIDTPDFAINCTKTKELYIIGTPDGFKIIHSEGIDTYEIVNSYQVDGEDRFEFNLRGDTASTSFIIVLYKDRLVMTILGSKNRIDFHFSESFFSEGENINKRPSKY